MNNPSEHKPLTLADVGEFALVQQILLPTVVVSDIASPLGDDCVYVHLPSEPNDLVVTSDVAPRPLAWHLGHESYRTWGWYAVVINLSDLAAAGATPLVITTSVEAPGNMIVDDFREFFEGMAEACQEYGIANGGGNVREAPKFACHVTAIGVTPTNVQLRRNGAHPGDLIVSVGECGRFANAYVIAKNHGFDSLSPDEKTQLCRPRARVNEMQILHGNGLVNAASDNSDGVLGTLWNIAEASKCTIELDMSPENLPEYVTEVASEFGYNPWNLLFFWGDWQVVVSVPSARSDDFWRVAKEHSIPVQHLGRVCEGPPKLMGLSEGRRRKLKLLRNENFSKSSFNKNVTEHVEYMLRSQLCL